MRKVQLSLIGMFLLVLVFPLLGNEYIQISEPIFRYRAGSEEFWSLNDSFPNIYDGEKTLYENLDSLEFVSAVDFELKMNHEFGNPIVGSDSIYLGNIYAIENGSPIKAPIKSVVLAVEFDPHYLGYHIVLMKLGSSIPIRIAFGHLRQIFVQVGEIVDAGEVIAETGSSGGTRVPELFVGVKYGSVYIRPDAVVER